MTDLARLTAERNNVTWWQTPARGNPADSVEACQRRRELHTRNRALTWENSEDNKKAGPAGNRTLAPTVYEGDEMADCHHTCRVCSALANPNLPDRFWRKVEITETCWLWTAHLDRRGYGRFDVGGTPAHAHRVAYELAVGPIPDAYEVDHLCWTPRCVNPAHLRAVTPAENRANKRLKANKVTSGGITPAVGIRWHTTKKRWRVEVVRDGRVRYGGRHKTYPEALAALGELLARLDVEAES